MDDPKLNYCIYCRRKLKKIEKFTFCTVCVKRFKISAENSTSVYVNTNYASSMIYCYNCDYADELFEDKEENCKLCLGCNLEIPLSKNFTEVSSDTSSQSSGSQVSRANVTARSELEKNPTVLPDSNVQPSASVLKDASTPVPGRTDRGNDQQRLSQGNQISVTSDENYTNLMPISQEFEKLIFPILSKKLELQRKWKKIGIILKLPIPELNKYSSKGPQEAFNLMLSLWKRQPPDSEKYTWNAFCGALLSPSVNEKELSNEISSMLNCDYPSGFGEEIEEEDDFQGVGNECKDLKPFGKRSPAKALINKMKDFRDEDYVAVCFHAILPKSKWKLKPSQDVFVVTVPTCYNKKTSPDVKFLHGPLSISRVETLEFEEFSLYMATFALPLFSKEANYEVLYKYVVMNTESKLKASNILEEDLCIGGREWRVVKFSNLYKKKVVHQFDPVILPPGSVGIIKTYLGNPKTLVHESVSSALKVYLSLNAKLWLGTEGSLLAMEEFRSRGDQLFNFLWTLQNQTSYYKKNKDLVTLALDEEPFFYKIVFEELSCAITEFVCMEKLCAAFIVTYVLKSLNFKPLSTKKKFDFIKESIKAETADKLLKGFYIPMEHFPQSCSIAVKASSVANGHYDDVVQFMKTTTQDFRHFLDGIIRTLCQVLLETNDESYVCGWLQALPLLHILEDINSPQPSKWTAMKNNVYALLFSGLDIAMISRVQKKLYLNSSYSDGFYDVLRAYFDVDHLMPKVWISVIPITENKYPLHKHDVAPFACWHIGMILNQNSDIPKIEWNPFLVNLLAAIKLVSVSDKETALCFKGADYILKYFQGKKLNCYFTAFQLMWQVLEKTSKRNDPSNFSHIQNCSKSALKWIELCYSHTMVGSKADEEIKDWCKLLKAGEDISFMNEDMNRAVHRLLNKRLDQLDVESKAQVIVAQSIKDESITESLTENFLTHQTANDRDRLLSFIRSADCSQGTLIVVEGILSSLFKTVEEVNFASVFSLVLCDCLRKYDDCLNSGYTFTSKQHHTSLICAKATEQIVSFNTNLKLRSLALKVLDTVIECKDLQEIFSSFQSLKCIKDLKQSISFNTLSIELQAYEGFKQRKKKVLHLILKILDIAEEASMLKDKLSDDFSSYLMKDVWEFTDELEKPVYLVPGLNCTSQDVVDEIFNFTSFEERAFQIFKNRWASAKKDFTSKQKHSVTIAAFVSEFWIPLKEEFHNDLLAISNGLKLPLKKVTELFEGLSDRKLVEQELEMWCAVFNFNGEAGWIRSAAQKIIDYQQLTFYSKSAHTLIQLKNTLKLKGDFNILNKLLESEEDSSTADLTLASVDISAKETVGVLKEIAEHPTRRLCLEVFCSCTELVNWIRKMAKNVGMLAEVVQVSNQTMEGDLMKQRLSDLLVFGSAFAPLIYEVSSNESCESLVNRCKSLWTFLDTHPNLHIIAKECSKNLGDFLRIEEALTDFQKSNVEQMNLINKRGIYAISTLPGKIHNSPEDAIRLRLREVEKEDEQKVFTLSDLKDLQSKLVLAAAENADSVKKFIDILMKVERIAELVISLQESGLIDYTHYTLSFACSAYVKNEVDDHILKLEKTLRDWKGNVRLQRKKYPQLNYYTSQQLLDLQKEFGRLKSDMTAEPSCKLMLLLLSITAFPRPDKIQRAISIVSSATASKLDNFSASKNPPTLSLKPIAIGGTSISTKPKVSDLDEEEKKIFDNLIDLNYDRFLIMKAFEACPKGADENELMFWCMDNESTVQLEDEEVFMLDNECCEQESSFEITKDDPQVKELLEDDYSLKIAIEAVKLSKSSGISPQEAVLSLELGKSPLNVNKTGWSVPSKYTLIPFTVKIDVPKNHYITLVELGDALKELACSIGEKEVFSRARPLRQRVIEKGQQNVIDTDEVWKTVLYLYMADVSLPLPTTEEVLVCTENTSVEEVTLLWHRAVNDSSGYRIFTLVNGEKLPFKVCEEVLNNLEMITQSHSEFRLVIVVNSREQSKSYITSRLGSHLRHVPSLPSSNEVASYIMKHTQTVLIGGKGSNLSDDEKKICDDLKHSVQSVLSVSSGMGKSLLIQKFAHVLKKEFITDDQKPHYVCIPVHGPEVSVSRLLRQLQPCEQDPNNSYPQLIHFNVAISMVEKLDWLFFEIFFLGCLADGYGNIWRKVSSQICVVECTLPKLDDTDIEKWSCKSSLDPIPATYDLLSFLPRIVCTSPKTVIALSSSGKECVPFNEEIFKKKSVQRVYQYLRRFECSMNLDKFNFSDAVEGKPEECLSLIFKFMSSEAGEDFDPSWAELQSFVTFLNEQLCDCESSAYGSHVGGFKDFIVQFSIVMAKEFTEPSMKIGRYRDDVTASNLEELYSVATGKTWNECAHPYLLFNRDNGRSMTFMGLWIDDACNLIHVKDKETQIVSSDYMKKDLREILKINGVKFMEEYGKMQKEQLLQKLLRVLGIDETIKNPKFIKNGEIQIKEFDPDESYVLTLDNLMKMFAIHMKFRCGIPVVMMGETGCGKTRLLRYLCEVLDRAFDTKTLCCLKVHGGTNEHRIMEEVEKAIALAQNNEEKHGNHVYTVLFFDEVNTTEALDLVKEIICDRTFNGKPLPDKIKFAAACNPYRVHDDDTLRSLQAAGLGFYLRDEERIPKLGTIPLRKLVYRVLPLPSSLNQYVYDFGTVSGEAEGQYIRKIVMNQIKGCRHIPENSIGECHEFLFSVLEECQRYMRSQKNECKYVSLRDVVRAMLIFKFFLEKLKTVEVFRSCLLDQIEDDSETNKAAKELNDITRALVFSISVCYYARLSDRVIIESEQSDQDSSTSHLFLTWLKNLVMVNTNLKWTKLN